jgi:UPF0271 protein
MVIVLDTSAILSGKYFLGQTITVPTVIDEFKVGGHSWRLVEYAQSAGMQVRSPASTSRQQVTIVAKQTGDDQQLSDADLDVLALAFELGREQREVILMTDDYAIQNVAAAMGIPVQGILQPGIQQHWHWIFRCSSCGRTYDVAFTECPVCGGALRRSRAR